MMTNHGMLQGMVNHLKMRSQGMLMRTMESMLLMNKYHHPRNRGSMRRRKVMFKFLSYWGRGA